MIATHMKVIKGDAGVADQNPSAPRLILSEKEEER